MKYSAVLLIFFLLLSGTASTRASCQDKPSTLLIGLVPEINVFKQKQRFNLLGAYLRRKTGIEIRFTILSRYGNIIDRFQKERMDAAFFGSFTGALAVRKLGVVPLARPVNPDDTSTYHGYLFVKKNSGIKSARDMRGKRMAFVEKATTAGYLFPLAYLRETGITGIDGFFSEYFFAGSHDAAIKAVLDGSADIGAAKHSIYERMRESDARVDRELVVIAESPRVPSNGLCVRKGLDAAVRQRLKQALLEMHADAEGAAVLAKFGALRFIETTAGDYQPVFDLAGRAGIDIMTYRYRNQ